ncbi:MAG: twin-arginine translocase subunit TatC [Verrucomicrobiota bacterium]
MDSEHHEEQEPAMTFLEHLEELRWTLVKSIVALILAMGLCLVFATKIMSFLQAPLFQVLEKRDQNPEDFLLSLNPVDPLTLSLQIGFFAGFIVAFPLIAYFIGSFVNPALKKQERYLLVPTFLAGLLLFIGGAAFCYCLLLPQALRFFIEWSELYGLRPQWPFTQYVGFVLQMLIAFGLSFELPLLIAILSKLGFVHSRDLGKYRRHAVVGIVIFCACVTPTSDPFTLGMMFGPMYLLYEGSILISRFIEWDRRKRLVKEGLMDDLD